MAPLALEEWSVDQLRLTAFPVLGATQRSIDWWQESVGVEPDETASRKGISEAAGPFGSGKLVLRYNVERVDWLLVPRDIDLDESKVAEAPIPSIGGFAAASEAFVAMASRWLTLPNVPELGRIAVGAVLRHVEADRESGYRRLPDYVPVEVDVNSRDFMYQINHPITSRTEPGLELNRLSKWMVAVLQLVNFEMTVGPGGIAQQEARRDPIQALRLELDLSTPAEVLHPLPRRRLVDIFVELVGYGEQIIRQGVRQP